jgi:hypothetical protein
MNRERYYITVNRPKDVTYTEMRNYIREAVNGWKGQSLKGDPFFCVDLDARVIREPIEDRERHAHVNDKGQPRRWGEVALAHLPKVRSND